MIEVAGQVGFGILGSPGELIDGNDVPRKGGTARIWVTEITASTAELASVIAVTEWFADPIGTMAGV